MKRFMGAFVVLVIIAALQFAGCKKENTLEPTVSDQQFFADVVSGNDAATHDIAVSDEAALYDGELFSVAQQPMPPTIQDVTAGSKIIPQKWGRFINSVTRTITRTTNSGDSVSMAEAIVTFNGYFAIVGTVDGVVDTIKKPYTESMHRFFRFVRVANTRNGRVNWRLDAVSIVNGGTSNAQISITKIQVVPPTGDTLIATEPDNYFMQVSHRWMHRLPLWGMNTQVTVIATVHSTDVDTDLVMLHYVPRDFGLHRIPMIKISDVADPSGGFNRVYSTMLTIPGNDKKFAHILVSATTSSSLYSTDSTKFSSSLWGVPYKTSE